MEQLVERIVQWKIHPEDLITHKFLLKDTDKAYQEMAKGSCGKVAVIFGEQGQNLYLKSFQSLNNYILVYKSQIHFLSQF
jgi:hypothetical protein